MKSNTLTSILLGVLAISAVASLILCGLHIKYTREVRRMQFAVGLIQARQAGVQQLIAEVAEYSKRTQDNTEILQILQSVGVKPLPQSGAGATPTTTK